MARLTLAQLRESVGLKIANSPQISTADLNAVIKHAHRGLAAQYQWSFRKRDTVIQTVAPYNAGTVAVTPGSPTVTGAGTAWTSAMLGRQIRIAGENTFFWIGAVNVGPQTLTLADGNLATQNWVAPAAGAATYTIFQDQYPVPANVALILYHVRDWPLAESTLSEVDATDPRRTSTGTPDRWYWARDNITGTPQAESRFIGLWQVPSSAMTFRIPYLIEPPDLVQDTDLPVCPSEVIEWAAGAQAAAMLHARTGDERWARAMTAYMQVLMGTPQLLGVLSQALQDDAQRFGLPGQLQGTGMVIGNDRLASRDWDAF